MGRGHSAPAPGPEAPQRQARHPRPADVEEGRERQVRARCAQDEAVAQDPRHQPQTRREARGRAKGLAHDALLYTGPEGGKWDPGTFRRLRWIPAIELAAAKYGLIKRPRIHDIRHSHASWLIAHRVPLPAIQARLGHESITTVDRYGHLLDALDDEVVAAVDWAMDPTAALPGFLVETGLADATEGLPRSPPDFRVEPGRLDGRRRLPGGGAGRRGPRGHAHGARSPLHLPRGRRGGRCAVERGPCGAAGGDAGGRGGGGGDRLPRSPPGPRSATNGPAPAPSGTACQLAASSTPPWPPTSRTAPWRTRRHR
ncbi:tyrosine-type recombinase/integrase [Streptomyces albidoflavus]